MKFPDRFITRYQNRPLFRLLELRLRELPEKSQYYFWIFCRVVSELEKVGELKENDMQKYLEFLLKKFGASPLLAILLDNFLGDYLVDRPGREESTEFMLQYINASFLDEETVLTLRSWRKDNSKK